MREINTHKVNGCNESIELETDDKLTLGGAPTNYFINVRKYLADADPKITFDLKFQDGPIAEVGTNGVTHEVLLAVVIDRLQSFQRGQFACRENALALTKIEEGLHWLQHRTKERLARGVEGTHNK